MIGAMAFPRFVATAIAWNLLLFGLLRLSWVETHLVAPLTAAEASAAQTDRKSVV